VRVLDLFCGPGGAAVGYSQAGFEVYGIDNVPQPAYPFDLEQGDAMVALEDVMFCRSFDVIHASPPCQAYTALRTRQGKDRTYPDLVARVREALIWIGRPWVIENVVGAPLRAPITLCGSMFGLGLGVYTLRRHRLFETSVPMVAPRDECAGKPVVGVYGTGGQWARLAPGGGGVKAAGADAAAALGITHTTSTADLSQAIPPAYTRWIGSQLLALEVAS